VVVCFFHPGFCTHRIPWCPLKPMHFGTESLENKNGHSGTLTRGKLSIIGMKDEVFPNRQSNLCRGSLQSTQSSKKRDFYTGKTFCYKDVLQIRILLPQNYALSFFFLAFLFAPQEVEGIKKSCILKPVPDSIKPLTTAYTSRSWEITYVKFGYLLGVNAIIYQ